MNIIYDNIKIIDKLTNNELETDSKLYIKKLMNHSMIKKVISQKLYGFVYTSMIEIELKETFNKNKNSYETVIYYTDFIDILLKINTKEKMKNIVTQKMYKADKLKNYIDILYLVFLKDKNDNDAIDIIKTIDSSYLKVQYDRMKLNLSDILKATEYILSMILEYREEKQVDNTYLLKRICELTSKLSYIDNKEIDNKMIRQTDVKTATNELEADEESEEEIIGNNANEEDSDEESEEEIIGNNANELEADEESEEEIIGNNANEEDSDEESEEEIIGNNVNEEDSDEDNDEKIVRVKNDSEETDKMINIMKKEHLIMITILKICNNEKMKYILSKIYKQYTENKYISDYELKYKNQIKDINQILSEYILYYFTLEIITDEKKNINNIFYSFNLSDNIPFVYLKDESCNQNINTYKIFNVFMKRSLTLKWALNTKSFRKDGIYAKYMLSDNEYVDINIIKDHIYFQNNIDSYDNILLQTNLTDRDYREVNEDKFYDINLNIQVSNFDMIILLDLIMNVGFFQNTLFVSDNYKSDINYYPCIYVDSFKKKKHDIKIYLKGGILLFNITKIDENSLLRLKVMIMVLIDTYNNYEAEITTYYKKLGYKAPKKKELSDTVRGSCPKDKLPKLEIITPADFTSLLGKDDSYLDNLNNIVNPSYYVMNDNTSYKKVSCLENKKHPYIGIHDKKRNNLSHFCCYKQIQNIKPNRNEQVNLQRISYEEFEIWKKINQGKFKRDILNNFITDKEYVDYTHPDVKNRSYNLFKCTKNNHFLKFTNTTTKEKIRENIYDFKCVDNIYITNSNIQNKKTFPPVLNELFKICNIQNYSIMSTNTDVSDEHTFGECISIIYPDIYKQFISMMETKDSYKYYYNTISAQDCTKTSLDEFKIRLFEKNINESFKTCFEHWLRCNIIIFDLNTYQIHLPKHINGYYVNFLYDKNIILFYDSKKNRYHHLGLSKKKQNYFINSNDIKPIIQYYNQFIFNLNMSRDNIMKVTYGKNIYKISSQYIDSSGKVRGLYIKYNNTNQYIYVETSPLQPLVVSTVNNMFNMSVEEKHIIYVRKVIGHLFGTNNLNEKYNKKEKYYIWNINDIEFKLYIDKKYTNSSRLVNFIYQKEFSTCLKEHTLWLSSTLHSDYKSDNLFIKRDKALKDIITNINQKRLKYMELEKKDVIQNRIMSFELSSFQKQAKSLSITNFYSLLDNSYRYEIKRKENPFIYNGKILIDDYETEKKLKYIINHEMIRNKQRFINYKDEKFIRSFKNIRNKKNKVNTSFMNFNSDNNQNIVIESYDELVQYLLESYLEKKIPLETRYMF